MRFLGVTETCDLGSLYLRLIAEGHEVRVAISDPAARGTMAGMVTQVQDWRAQLSWIREAGGDGVVLFEAVSDGFGAQQDDLRGQGFQVVGGSAFGDRLENDRAFAQRILADLGFPTGHVWEFAAIDEALAWIERHPKCYVAKFSGPDYASGDNFVGQLDDGTDVEAFLAQRVHSLGPNARLILMDYIDGIEIGIGAYFDGTRFITPACLDWEHKRFFAGDMGELTGEMGTVATFSGSDSFFTGTLRKLEPLLAGRGHVGYINLNTIVNDHGIWPLEFTCRFGYPGFAVLDPLQAIGWGALFAGMVEGSLERMPTHPGFSTGVVVTTPPFPYTRKQVSEPVGLPILFAGQMAEEDHRNIHLGEVGKANARLVTSGLYGWTMVVTGTGASVAQSRAAAYERIGKIVVPRGRYRLDIGERTTGEFDKLRSMGLIGELQ
ncbi:MAG: hypothetical protein ABR588_04125 [Sphingomicrobium sp.]|nr:hypothetical protein [Sphingomonadales bacterium]